MTNSTDARIPPELLARYDRPGPRYTSYPTAVEFSPNIDAGVYESRLIQLGATNEGISLYVHLPFCKKRCWFCGCNVIVSPNASRALPYLNYLENELALLARHLEGRRVVRLHFGGGTPTYFSGAHLTSLAAAIFDVCPPAEEAECAIELDPRTTTHNMLDELTAIGFNRFSLGIQDLSSSVQLAIDRIHPVEQIEDVMSLLRRSGNNGVNFDLIYGLPRQTSGSFSETIDRVIELSPDRIALYSFAYVPWKHGHMKKIHADELPSRELKFELFAAAREQLIDSGFEPVGMDHFAQASDDLAVASRNRTLTRDFQGYSAARLSDTIGIGVSAIGDVRGTYVQNHKRLSRYFDAIDSKRLPVARGYVLDQDDSIRRHIIRELMCNFVLDIAACEVRFGICFGDRFEPELRQLEALERDGLVTVTTNRIEITEIGRMFVRNVAICFDRFRQERSTRGNTPVFSQTI